MLFPFSATYIFPQLFSQVKRIVYLCKQKLSDMKKLFLLTCMLLACTLMQAQNKNLWMPRFFADGMVLQRNAKIPMWGRAEAGTNVTVTMGGKTAKTTVKADGTWKVYLPAMKAGGPHSLVVTAKKAGDITRKEIQNVLVGDVFLCSGQSNMELPIRRCMDVVAAEVKDYSNNQIRYLKFPHQFNFVRPNEDVQTLPWQNITPQNCTEVSGICYFMARELQEKYHVPIGIINSAVGGTRVEAWMPHEVLASFDGYAAELAKPKYHQEHWVDSVRMAENRAGLEWERKMMETDTIVGKWRAEGYDFSAWKNVDMFSNWSQFKNGSYWFHTSIDLPTELAGEKAVLRFGAMKDADTIFVNGQYVGNTTYEYPPRVYTVKEGILKVGKNDIVVHLMSQSGMGNFTKGKLYQLEVGERVFPIQPELQMAVGCTMPRKPGSTYFVDTPTGLYNAMIAPLQDFPVKGMLWYQGESNLSHPDGYANLLEAMVASWRKQFNSQFPVVIMQLPGYMQKHDQPFESSWTKIRQEQYVAAQQIKGASLAPTFDTGEYNDIHPQDKKTAGERAARQMRKLAYGDRSIECDVPKPVSAHMADGAVLITFAEVGSGLTAKGGKLKDFAIRIDGKYQWADATVVDNKTVRVTLPANATVTSVRYGWDDYPQPSLYNKEGVPVPQFQIEVR